MGLRLTKLGEQHGIISRGLPSDAVAFSPPLIMTVAEINEMLDRMERALADLTVQVRRERLATV
jgi:4-aminobutyrate--pyruvate transaminase